MRALLRILVLIPIAYISACLVAALIFTLAATGGVSQSALADSDAFASALAVMGAILGPIIGAAVLAPSAVAILLAEIFAWRSIYIYLGFGTGIAIFAESFRGTVPETDGAPPLEAYLAAGLVAAVTYWIIAGRRAGLR